ncbi:MAG TPA: hypothetical protein VFZ98_07930 [Vicinamibacterales bacterium]
MARQLVGFAVGVGLLAGANGAWAQPADPPETAELRVLVVNQVGARPEIVQAAERDASAIYAAAGVRTAWVDADPGGTRVEDVDLTVVLAPDPKAAVVERNIKAVTLGFAATEPDLPGLRGRVAWVFYGRVEQHAEHSHIQISRLCGLVMAHEIGHLVLPPGHSDSGLMRATWLLQSGLLQYFTNDQTEAMHTRIAVARADLTGRN